MRKEFKKELTHIIWSDYILNSEKMWKTSKINSISQFFRIYLCIVRSSKSCLFVFLIDFNSLDKLFDWLSTKSSMCKYLSTVCSIWNVLCCRKISHPKHLFISQSVVHSLVSLPYQKLLYILNTCQNVSPINSSR